MPASRQPAQQKQDLVIQAGIVACAQSRPFPRTHTGRRAAPWAAAPHVGQDLPLASAPAAPPRCSFPGKAAFSSPHPICSHSLICWGQSVQVQSRARQDRCHGGHFLGNPGRKQESGPTGRAVQGKQAPAPLAGVGAWGQLGLPRGQRLARPLWSCCGRSRHASPRLHVGLESRWPSAHELKLTPKGNHIGYACGGGG